MGVHSAVRKVVELSPAPDRLVVPGLLHHESLPASSHDHQVVSHPPLDFSSI